MTETERLHRLAADEASLRGQLAEHEARLMTYARCVEKIIGLCDSPSAPKFAASVLAAIGDVAPEFSAEEKK